MVNWNTIVFLHHSFHNKKRWIPLRILRLFLIRSALYLRSTYGIYIFSDAIKQVMGTFAAAHQQSMADRTDKNASALAAAVDRISTTLSSRADILLRRSPHLPLCLLLHIPLWLQKIGRHIPPLRLPRTGFTSVMRVSLG